MAHDGADMPTTIILDDLLSLTEASLPELETLVSDATASLRAATEKDGRISAALLEENQYRAHGLAWLTTYQQSLKQLRAWAGRLAEEGKLGEMEKLILQIGFGEYLAQIAGGIQMNQGEMVRLADMGVSWSPSDAAATLIAGGNSNAARMRLVELIRDVQGRSIFGQSGLDEDLEMIREQFYRYAEDRVKPNAHEWHLKDELIPMEIIEELAELGVFGLTIPEEYGGLGLSKASMVVVTEELSRGYIGVGSLGTRSEIAAELIICGGTEEQKQKWLPGLSSGEILSTAVFTEPNTGSDLGSLRTRAVKDGDDWLITG
ncbi:MAG: acyl-CoA dehydrogenase, partial [Rhodobacteraceae bacterium]